jgi:hypothetical protein
MINALYQSSNVRVVVLISYNDIISKRLEGAIEIGRIISSLFYDFSKVFESIEIYFNKVP